MKNLRNANAIVTGASRGLGAHIARALARSGVNVAVAARSAQLLESVRAELVSLGVKAVAIRADVPDEFWKALLVALEKDADKRPQTAGEYARMLGAAAGSA